MDKTYKSKNLKLAAILILIFVALLAALIFLEENFTDKPEASKTPENTGTNFSQSQDETGTAQNETGGTETLDPAETVPKVTFSPAKDVTDGETMQVHFINLGDADSILVKCGKYNMLIDAGESSDGKKVLKYLQNEGVETIHYLIATHPDQDHIGGMDTVIENINVENFYMSGFVKDSKHYENLLDALKEKNLEMKVPEPGIRTEEFDLGQANCSILAPLKSYSQSASNNSSIVLRVAFGEKVFLFMGDVESDAEYDILARYSGLEADVVKIAHHGRSDATGEAFVNAVDPKYAVITCKEGNESQSVIERLENSVATTYVLGKTGDIVFSTDGKRINININ